MPIVLVSSEKEFKKVLKTYEKILVKFEANWSMQCKATVRAFEEISKLFKGVVFVSLDIDGTVKRLLKQFKIQCVPSFLYFVNGKYQRRITGLCTKPTLRKLLDGSE